MNKITSIKIKYADGSYSGQIPISVLASNISWDNDGHYITDAIGDVDINTTGSLQDQINKKVNTIDLSDYVNGQLAGDVADWLNTNVNPVGSAVVVDKTLNIQGAAADAKTVGDNFYRKTDLNQVVLKSAGEVKWLPMPYGAVNDFVSVFNNKVVVNGTISNRWILVYGNEPKLTTANPAYNQAYSKYYYDYIKSFIVGHKIKIKISLIEGSYNLNSSTDFVGLDMRNSQYSNIITLSGAKYLKDGDQVLICARPQMIALRLPAGTYVNSVFEFNIIDTTIAEADPMISQEIEEAILEDNDNILFNYEAKGNIRYNTNKLNANLDINFHHNLAFINGVSTSLTSNLSSVIYCLFSPSDILIERYSETEKYRVYKLTVQPNLANFPNAYDGVPIKGFELGHKYFIEIKLISGSYTLQGNNTTDCSDIFIEFWGMDGNSVFKTPNNLLNKNSKSFIGEWTCDALPDFAIFGIRAGNYDNAVFKVIVKDVTEAAKVTNSAINFNNSLEIFQKQEIFNENKFKFLESSYPIGYTNTEYGITYTITGKNSIVLDGTLTQTFNLNIAFHSFDVSPVMYYYIDSQDESITYDNIYLNVGYYDSEGNKVQGSPLKFFNKWVKFTAENPGDSRCYLHITRSTVTTFNNYQIKFFAVDKEPLISRIDNIFNSEPFLGEYDWQSPLVRYGSLFKGKTNVESFAFFTDPHILGFDDESRNEIRMRNYLKRVQKVYNSSPCSFIVCGGDWLNNSTTMDEACYRLGLLKGVAKNMLNGCHLVMGNHDTNYQGKLDAESEKNTGQLTNETIAAILYRDTDTKKAYYSFDGSNSKCYVLDSGTDRVHNQEENYEEDTGEDIIYGDDVGIDHQMSNYDWQQIEWLGEKLIEDDAPHAIIFIHILRLEKPTLALLIDAYNSHSNITLNNKSYDFTSCTGHVDFWVAGHVHSDKMGIYYTNYDQKTGGIPYFTTTTQKWLSDVPIIDLVLVDYDLNKVYLVRAGGAGSARDRTFNI